MTIKTKRNAGLLNSSSLFVLGTASVLLGSGPAQAFDANSLPTGGSVTGGSATIATSGNTLTVNQSSNRAIIDWRNFNIGANAQANFVQPGTSSIAVNRVNGSTDPSRIDGGLHANGQVWVLNPNGVFFGKTARVDAAGVVATTANINDKAFMAGSNKLQMTGGDNGQVVNEGHISVGEGGLAAFVAPSVRNSGTIRARLGKVTLAAGDTYTLDLAGDRLVEIGLGSNKAVVDQSGKIVNAGGVIEISAKAAGQVVDGVINTSGVTDASSVRSVGGKIVLGADVINVAADASLKADGTSGGQITAVANKTGNYAGSYSAQGTTGDGGQIETSGHTVTVASNAKVSASSTHGKAGKWTIDPLNVTITSGADNSTISGGTVTTGTIETALAGGTGVAITTDQSGTDDGDLTLASSINATSTGNAGLTLTGRHLSATGGSTVNIAGGALTLNVNTVNNTGNPSGTWIGDAIGMIGAVTGGSTVNVGAGTYMEQVFVNKSLTLNGAGQGQTIIAAPDLLAPSTNPNDFDKRAIISVSGYSNAATVSNLTVDGLGKGDANSGFVGIGFFTVSGTVDHVTVTGIRDGGVGGTLTGEQNGVGVLFDNQTLHPTIATLENSTITDFQKTGAAFTGTRMTANVLNNIITGAGSTGVIAQNGIELYSTYANNVIGNISGNTISGISYAPVSDWSSSAILVLGGDSGTVVENNTVTGAGTGDYSNGIYASGNNVVVSGNTVKDFGWGIVTDDVYTQSQAVANNLTVSNNSVTNNGVGLSVGYEDGDTSIVTAHGNDFSGNASGVELESANATLDATGNWWGTTDAATIETGMSGTAAANVNFSSFLASGTNTAATTGFQGDFSKLIVTTRGAGSSNRIGDAISLVDTGGIVELAGDFSLTSQLEINKNVTLQSDAGNRATISAGTDFAGNAAANAMILVDANTDFTFKNLKVDGSGYVVGQGLRSQGNTTVDNADFANIGSAGSYNGVAIAGIGGTVPSGFGSDTNSGGGASSLLTVTNSTFEHIGREGILVKGDGATANIDGITYTGKGNGDWIDYAVEAGAGGHVNLTNSTITGNTGVAASDGSISAGVLVTSYYGPGTEATLTGNTITGNTAAVGQGFDGSDESVVHAHGNDFSGNGVELTTALGTADYSQNYWGTTDGAAISGLMQGAEAASVDFSPFLTNGKSDFGHLAVTTLGGGDTHRIQEGINDVTAGGTVNVESGTYNEALSITTAGLTLHSVDPQGAIINAGGAAVGINVSSTSGPLGTLIIDGFLVENWTSGGIIQSMAAGPQASMRVTNNVVYGPGGAGATAHGNGIEVTGDGSVVSDNKVYSVHLNSPDWSGSNIIVANGRNITVKNNLVDGNDTGIAVTNWNNTAGMSNITISGNEVTNVAEGISIQTFEGEAFSTPSGAISGVSITGNNIHDNQTGIGVWDYSTAHNADWTATLSNVSGNTFANNGYQVSSDFAAADVTSLLSGNSFDRSVVNANGGRDATGALNLYGDLQTAIDNEAAASTLNLAGTFGAGVNVNKAGDKLIGAAGTVINVGAGQTGLTINADDVTVQNLEIAGPLTQAYTAIGWNTVSDPGNSWAIQVISPTISNFNITGNNIHDVRTGILVANSANPPTGGAQGAITGNTFENTKGGVIVQYRDGSTIDIADNHQGAIGNEWGVVYNTNLNPAIIAATAGASRQSFLLNVSNTNNGLTVLDRGYTNANRTAVIVDASANGTPDNGFGNARQPLASINAGLDAVVAGGKVNVLTGTYAEDVGIIAPATVTFDNVIVDSLSVLSTGAGSTLSGSVKAGSVTAFDINLGGDLSLDTSAAGGTIALANVDGAHNLTLNAGSGVVLAGGLGATTRLGAVDITADLIGLGATNKAASFDFNGDVALSAASTVIDTTVSNTAAGDITFAGDIFGFTDGGQSLTLAAGPGTGAKSANGDIAMNNAGLSTLRLGSMTVSGDDFTALTVDLAGGFTSQLTGNQLFAADTLNAAGDVNSNVAGNIGGHIVSGGNVNLTAAGNVSGDITGKVVSLTGQTVNSQVTANTLNVNAAQGGTITGTFTPGTVSNGLVVNGTTVGSNTGTGNTGTGNTGTGNTGTGNTGTGNTGTGNTGTGNTGTGDTGTGNTGTGNTGTGNTGTGNTGTGNTANNFPNVNLQQLVVEGFALPVGTQIGANGQLILPAGTVLGLLSPGGGTPRVIMVQTVQELGALLDQGYSAIVIDLTGHKKATKVASN